MKKVLLTILCQLTLSIVTQAHTIDYQQILWRHWSLVTGHKTIEGAYLMIKDRSLYIEQKDHQVVSYPLGDFAKDDQVFALERYNKIQRLNHQPVPQIQSEKPSERNNDLLMVTILCSLLVGMLLYWQYQANRFLRSGNFRFAGSLGGVGMVVLLVSVTTKLTKTTATNPLFIDSAFAPYKPAVSTHWDTAYFYVSSYGIPAHEMMVGITNWQQQVPIPQCYTGANSWSIPLKPVLAPTPVPTATHFFRGAIAIAANGVPIFNALTNTGLDAYLTGQLDNFGGHCGMADDYHYHIAPMHLAATSGSKPIAFALDGFAVYGSLEPDGSAMMPLDANHGHMGLNGVYHYHGTPSYPYMIGSMVGKVTEDTTAQIIPQAVAHPVRPGQTPLGGSVITGCKAIGGNGYKVWYTLSGQTDTISYDWTATGLYTFNFILPITGTTTKTYNGFAPCYVPTGLTTIQNTGDDISVYPNPAKDAISLIFNGKYVANDITGIAIYNMQGQLLQKVDQYKQSINISSLSTGNYIVAIQCAERQITRKFSVY